MALLAVVGAHLSGQPLNHQLTDRGGQLVTTTRTASTYRLFALPSPLCLGTVQLADDTAIPGFLCEELATRDSPDITRWGGWRAYLRSGSPD